MASVGYSIQPCLCSNVKIAVSANSFILLSHLLKPKFQNFFSLVFFPLKYKLKLLLVLYHGKNKSATVCRELARRSDSTHGTCDNEGRPLPGLLQGLAMLLLFIYMSHTD